MSIHWGLKAKAGGDEFIDPDVVDLELCNMLGKPVDEVHYVRGWWDLLAYVGTYEGGLSSPRVRELLSDDVEIVSILEHLDKHYVLHSWRTVGGNRGH